MLLFSGCIIYFFIDKSNTRRLIGYHQFANGTYYLYHKCIYIVVT